MQKPPLLIGKIEVGNRDTETQRIGTQRMGKEGKEQHNHSPRLPILPTQLFRHYTSTKHIHTSFGVSRAVSGPENIMMVKGKHHNNYAGWNGGGVGSHLKTFNGRVFSWVCGFEMGSNGLRYIFLMP
uniref:Uncharacterized protein n=1 Tax=Eutreptiella gymnastica TaxID=73025 RepID=A0A7S1NUA7_9EUGL